MAKQQPRYHSEDAAAAITQLFAAIKPDSRVFIGIDPGLEGAIAFLPEDATILPVIVDMPTLQVEVAATAKSKKKAKAKAAETGKPAKTPKLLRNVYDYLAICRLLDPAIDNVRRCVLVLEHTGPRPIDTAMTGFGMGVSYGMWQLFLPAFGFSVMEEYPGVWKKRMGLKASDDKAERKDASRLLAMKLFPHAEVFLRCKGDHNRAEALLLAECGRRKQAGL